ncbi:MAG: hypothetical protein WCA35_11820 [Kovacikia sp.]
MDKLFLEQELLTMAPPSPSLDDSRLEADTRSHADSSLLAEWSEENRESDFLREDMGLEHRHSHEGSRLLRGWSDKGESGFLQKDTGLEHGHSHEGSSLFLEWSDEDWENSLQGTFNGSTTAHGLTNANAFNGVGLDTETGYLAHPQDSPMSHSGLKQYHSRYSVPTNRMKLCQQYQICWIRVPYRRQRLLAILSDGWYYRFAKLEAAQEKAFDFIEGRVQRGEQVVMTIAKNGYAIWILEEEAYPDLVT